MTKVFVVFWGYQSAQPSLGLEMTPYLSIHITRKGAEIKATQIHAQYQQTVCIVEVEVEE